MPSEQKTAIGPTEDEVAQGEKFGSCITGEHDAGAIVDEAGNTLWRYGVEEGWARFFPISLFYKPDFIVTDQGRSEALRIRRRRRVTPAFEMLQEGRIVGTIRYRNLLRTCCTLQFGSEPAWTFYQPLFTVFFRGSSEDGGRFWVRVGPSKKQWNILTKPGASNLPLLAALAFMHREYWTH